jgi:hypothetical protein
MPPSQRNRKTESASTGQRPQMAPPIPKSVLRALYQALLWVRLAQEQAAGSSQKTPDGMIVAATLPLRPHDLLIPPTDPLLLLPCELLKSSHLRRNRFPQLLPVAPRAHWQIAMAIHLALGWKHRWRSTAVLAIVSDDFLSPPQRSATLEMLSEASRQKLPIVYLTRRLQGRGAKLASSLQTGGVPRIAVDGGDVVAIYRVCQEALRRAREGTGPTIVECHFLTQGDDLLFLESLLARYGLWSPARKQQLLREFQAHRPTRRPHSAKVRRRSDGSTS